MSGCIEELKCIMMESTVKVRDVSELWPRLSCRRLSLAPQSGWLVDERRARPHVIVITRLIVVLMSCDRRISCVNLYYCRIMAILKPSSYLNILYNILSSLCSLYSLSLDTKDRMSEAKIKFSTCAPSARIRTPAKLRNEWPGLLFLNLDNYLPTTHPTSQLYLDIRTIFV